MNDLTVQEVAALYWACLEAQNNVGITWEVFSRIPCTLRDIAPLKRRLRKTRSADGVQLLGTVREFCPNAAKKTCEAIGWELSELLNGIEHAKSSFFKRLCEYHEYKRALLYYQ